MGFKARGGRKSSSLEQVLAYRHDDLLHRFVGLWEMSLEDAEELFDDTKRFLWLCANTSEPLGIDGPLVMLDEMWHNFVLYTPQYTDFCTKHFGRYLHHLPTSQAEKEKVAREAEIDAERVRRAHAATMKIQRRIIGQKLGRETLLRWYVDYPKRYDQEFLETKKIATQMSWRPPATLVKMRANK